MLSIAEFYIEKNKLFITLKAKMLENSVLRLNENIVEYRVLSANKIVVPLESLVEILGNSTDKSGMITLNDNELRSDRVLMASQNFRYFKITENYYFFFDNNGSLAVISISANQLCDYLNELDQKEVQSIDLTDEMVTVNVGASWINQIHNVLLYQNNTRRELLYWIEEDKNVVHIALGSIDDPGEYKLCLDISDGNSTSSFFITSSQVNNQSSCWIVDVKDGLSLTSTALAINFDSKDVGVVNYVVEQNSLDLTLVSDEIPFEKVEAINNEFGEIFELDFEQTGNKLHIDFSAIAQTNGNSYLIQGTYFGINFKFYMPQSKEDKIAFADNTLYFSNKGHLFFSGSTEITNQEESEEYKTNVPRIFQYFTLSNSIMLVSNSVSLETRTVSIKALYNYPNNKYVNRKIKTKKLVETIFQNQDLYTIVFNEDKRVYGVSLVHKKIKSKIKLPFFQASSGEVSIRLSRIFNYFGDIRADYDLVFAFQDDEKLEEFAISQSTEKGTPNWQRYFDSEDVPNNPKNNIATRLYFDKKGKVSLLNRAVLPTDEHARNLPIKQKITAVKEKGSDLRLEISYNRKKLKEQGKYLKVESAYLYKTINQTETIDLNIIESLPENLTLSVPLEKLVDQHKLGHYVIVLVVSVMGRTFHVKVIEPTKEYAEKLNNSRFVFSQKVDGIKRVVLPKLGGPKDFTLFIDDFKSVDSKASIWMENQAVKKYTEGKVTEVSDKYILYEKEANYAEDNGFALFEWIQENVPNNNSYYVINKDSPHMAKLEKYKEHLLYPGTMKYFKHLLTCKVVVGSENPIHMYDGDRAKISPFMNKVMFKKEVVFLQHGVTAMKNISKFKNFRADSNVIDYFVATNQEEKITIHENLGYDYFRVPVLGFTRWDKFDFSKKEKSGTILYVPTNRQWLVKATDEEFMNSDYYQGILDLITDHKLQSLLEKNNLTFQVFVHPLMQKFTKTLTALSPSVEILSIEDNDLGELLRSASLLITDYSSVAWDFAVQRKPVIFYQFDREVYENKIGSFIDLENIPIGHSYKNVEDVIDDVQTITENHFEIDKSIANKITQKFGKYERNICAKTYEFINKIS